MYITSFTNLDTGSLIIGVILGYAGIQILMQPCLDGLLFLIALGLSKLSK